MDEKDVRPTTDRDGAPDAEDEVGVGGPVAGRAALSAEPGSSVRLAGDHRLLLERRDGEDVLRLRAPDGRVRVALTVSAAGASIELDGTDLAIRTSGTLDLDVRSLRLRAREELRLESGGDLEVRADGSVLVEGLEQQLVARRGDLSVYANDDVRIDGERIKMNC